ncbi:MAG: hypothetical protein M3069_21515 [Chloroflexota bacterium]|nr:hypothetical protein [Chloroflexota bacterium]
MQVLSDTRATSAAELLGGPHGGAYRPPAVGVHGERDPRRDGQAVAF